MGRSRSAASNLLRLLNLAEPVQTMLMAGDLDMGHAGLLALERRPQITANQIAAKRCRCARPSLAKSSAPSSTWSHPSPRRKSRDLKRVEEELSDLLTAEVEVRVKSASKRHGRVENGRAGIHFGSLDELNGLIEKLQGWLKRKNLPRVHDVLRVQRALDGAHHVPPHRRRLRVTRKSILCRPTPCSPVQVPSRLSARATSLWLSSSAISRSLGMVGSSR